MNLAIRFAESAAAPDWLLRNCIRFLIRRRLREENRSRDEGAQEPSRKFLDLLSRSPIAVNTRAANEQHYEVPPDFFIHALGKRLKYSCCYYSLDSETLDSAEERMLALTCERAGVKDGMDLLDLGCGWGSLTLWMAEHYPKSRITSISNSGLQRKHILEQCRKSGYENVQVITADINEFETEQRFDRIVSIEMFEHMRNYNMLLKKIAAWMKPEARLFVHIFCHRKYSYLFETEGAANWMGRYFFTGGLMPSYDLLLSFQDDLVLEERWRVNGKHYQKTAEHWLSNMDLRRSKILPVLEAAYGAKDAARWFQRWRLFFMACAELWGFRKGEEWLVAHYTFRKKIK